MKKRVWLTALTSLVLMLGGSVAANAEILPSHGFGQIGLTSVVLCDSLSLYQKPDTDSKLVEKLKYGDRVIVTDQSDGWARCVLGDSEDAESGWVKSDYIVIDPQWYMTEDPTTVYAWGDAKANKVGLLSKDTKLPILKNDDDWVVVSLRGASGWIRKTDKDRTGSGSAGSSTESKKSTADSSSQEAADDYYFTVYAEDGLTACIHPVGGAMYEDAKGRTYILQDGGIYYSITTDTNYSADPDYRDDEDEDEDYEWTGRDFGEIADETTPDEDEDYEWTGRDFGEIADETMPDEDEEEEEQEWTGRDFGEIADETMPDEDYDEN